MKLSSWKKKSGAFTLLELSIATVITALVMGGVVMLLVNTKNFYEVAGTDGQLFQKSQFAMNFIVQELKNQYLDKINLQGSNTSVSYNPVIGWDTSKNKPSYQKKKRKFMWRKGQKDLLFFEEEDSAPLVICENVKDFQISIHNPPSERVIIYMELSFILEDGAESRSEKIRREIYIPKEPK
jgi:hypothetical protein